MTGLTASLQGRNVYGSGSYAPTRGQVSAQGMQGYLRREMRGNNQGMFGGVSRFGRDGRSDTRSGMAAQALARQQRNRPGNQKGLGGVNWRDRGRTAFQGQNRGNSPASPGGNAQGAAVGAPASSAPPTVTVNDAGILELPYSPAWNQEILGGLQDTNSALLALQQQQQQQALQYASDKRMAGIGYDETQRQTLNDSSGRGTAFSSGYGVAVGRNANDYNNLLNSLDLDNSQANAGYDFDRTAIINAFKDQLRQGSLAYADSLVEGAGTLGYGSRGPGYQQTGTGRGPTPKRNKNRRNKNRQGKRR